MSDIPPPSSLDTQPRFAAAVDPSRLEGQHIGPYRLLRCLGQGGMGAVYLAERDDEQYQKRVAVKVVRPGLASQFVLGRFRQERQILARLEHPNIARLLDGGTTPQGEPYFVMEYVDGRPIDQYCDERTLSIAGRLALFRQVCEAVQHAHRNLVVHRDLKPGNILVSTDGRPHLLDFGIAKLLEPQSFPDAAVQTQTAQRLLTPAYASPEQIRGEPITTVSDVFSLGILLYELLTGQRPAGPTTDPEAATLAATTRATDPTRPSAAIARAAAPSRPQGEPLPPAEVARRRGTTVQRLRRELRGDLDNIVLTAIRHEPERRYASAQQLAEDLRNYALGRPVQARPDTFKYRAAKFVRRNRLGVVASLGVVLSLVVGIVLTTWQAHVAEVERGRAERRFREVRRLAKTLIFDIHDRIAPLPGSTPVRHMIVREALGYLDRLSKEATGTPELTRELAEAYRRLGNVQGNQAVANLGDRAGAMRSYLRAMALQEELVWRHGYDPEARRQLARTFALVAEILWEESDIAGSALGFRAAAALLEPLVAAQPVDRKLGQTLAMVRISLGDSLAAQKRRRAAEAELRAALALLEPIVARNPSDAWSRRMVSVAWSKVGHLQRGARDFTAALGSYRRSLRIREENLARKPGDPGARRDLAAGLGWVGKALLATGDLAGARDMYQRGLLLDEEALAKDPRNVQARRDVAVSYLELARLEKALARKDSARGAQHRTAACRWLRRCLAAFESMKREGKLARYDEKLPGQLRRETKECEVATARSGVGRQHQKVPRGTQPLR